MLDYFKRCARFVAGYLPLILMIWGAGFGLFFYGFEVADRHWALYDGIAEASTNLRVGLNQLDSTRFRSDGEASDVSPDDVAKHWVVTQQPVDDGAAFLLTGGSGEYLKYCPEHGCAAVILKRDGSLVHAYPYRPDELINKRTFELPYGELMHDDAKDTAVFGLAPLPNGDLIAVYDFRGTVPYDGGIARMDKDGHLLWYRRDYTGHWPKVTAQSEILAITRKVGPQRISISVPKGTPQTLVCARGVPLDLIRVLDFDGHVKDEVPIFEALRASPYWSYLLVDIDHQSPRVNACDPLHPNSVVLVGPELAARLKDVQPDDLLISLRHINALLIIGRKDHVLKHLFSGTFLHQHSAQLVPGGKILLFDNLGGSAAGGPSRVLLYDPVTGEERTIIGSSPRDPDFFSQIQGNINVSEDGTRALVAVTERGKAYEIRLADGQVLTTFENLHDLRALPEFANSAKKVRYFNQYGVYYVSPHLAD